MDVYRMGLRPTSPTRPITPECSRIKHTSGLSMWQKFQHLFHRDHSPQPFQSDDMLWTGVDQQKLPKQRENFARPVGVGLPRQTTFKRQKSEERDRLCPVLPLPQERRATSASRQNSSALVKFRSSSVPSPAKSTATHSVPNLARTTVNRDADDASRPIPPADEQPPPTEPELPIEYDRIRPLRPPSITSSIDPYDDQDDYFEDKNQLNRELDTKWILNLSMHFRDKSDREKFFVTYAETACKWRRVTVSCDYRNAKSGSLEMDLKELQLQRDKSMQIYEAIRDSLLEIKFYDTVTNLKLETSDGRLHVHVTEDVNEIIPYPPRSSLQHILRDVDYRPMEICESELSFDAHLSGFVYKVNYQGKTYIKKEIPGPDTVDEFLYEVNALHALHGSQHVINLEAIITDDSGQFIKGLLIGFAERGAIVDLLYDYKGEIAWEHRERWARHAVQGLSEIHEEGYVQGDFTLSNIVVDEDNNAKIIDINRRGCPVGWEPPEIARKIASNQRISMYIGQKSDLYQLGMTLWALAMDDDEPERHDPPLSTQEFPSDVPLWYQDVVRICLSHRARDRLSATDLIRMFPTEDVSSQWGREPSRPIVRIRSEKQYIDPQAAVERDDLERFRHETSHSDEVMYSPESSQEDYTFTWPQSSNYDREYDSESEEIERPRGRRRVSEHDLMLQAQQREHQAVPMDEIYLDGNELPGNMASNPSNRNESHGLDLSHESNEVAQASKVVEELSASSSTASPPIMSTANTAQLRLSQSGSFHGRSELSEDTPRNSTLRLVGSNDYEITRSSPAAHDESILDGLTRPDSPLHVRDHSMDHDHDFECEGPVDGTKSFPRATLSFADSGYADSNAFGVEEDDTEERNVYDYEDVEMGGLQDVCSSVSETLASVENIQASKRTEIEAPIMQTASTKIGTENKQQVGQSKGHG